MAKYLHQKNAKFKKEINDSDKSRILGVAFDPSKDFHRVVIFSFEGKILIEPFSIDTLKKGYELLKRNIKIAKNRIRAKKIYLAIEHAGSYSENLFNHLSNDFGDVFYVSPNAVASNRKQRMLQGLKTDDIDAGAVGDLLIRGEFMEHHKLPFLYKKLRNLIYYREKKIVLRSILKNQISFRMDKIYPGINNSYGDNKQIFSKMRYSHVTYKGFINSGKTVRELLEMSNAEIMDEFGYKVPSAGPVKVRQLRERLNQMLPPDEKLAKEELKLFKSDIEIFNKIDSEIENVDREIVELGKMTQAKYLMGQIKGIPDIWASIYVGLVGDFRHFKSAGHVYSLAGLSPKMHQSGTTNKTSLGIKRIGNKQLRSVLFKMATQVMVCEPSFQEYYYKVKKNSTKHWKKIRIALCRKLNKTMFALIRDRKPFVRCATGSSS